MVNNCFLLVRTTINIHYEFVAIREDRTRGGRSTYQCSYSLPPSLTSHPELRSSTNDLHQSLNDQHGGMTVKLEPSDSTIPHSKRSSLSNSKHGVPPLLQVSCLCVNSDFVCTLK